MIFIAIILCGLNISRNDCNLIDPRIVTFDVVQTKQTNTYTQALLNRFAGMPNGTELFVGKGVSEAEILKVAKDKAWCVTDLKEFKVGVTRLVLQDNKFVIKTKPAKETIQYVDPGYYYDCPSCRRYR